MDNKFAKTVNKLDKELAKPTLKINITIEGDPEKLLAWLKESGITLLEEK